jgi:hypothetical protein
MEENSLNYEQLKPIYIHLHVVKTGGTTIGFHLKKNLDGYRDANLNREASQSDVWISGHVWNLYYGEHNKYKDKEPKYILIIRNPADWLVSMYHQDIYRKKAEVSFETWYNNPGQNTVYPLQFNRNRLFEYIRCFLKVRKMEIVKRILKGFWFLGLTEELDEDLPDIFIKLGISLAYKKERATGEYSKADNGIIEKKYTLTDRMRNQIYKDNEKDMEIFDYIKEIRKQRKWKLKLV